MEETQSKSIRVKLVEIFVIVSVTVFVIVIFIYYNLNRTIREMDTVYNRISSSTTCQPTSAMSRIPSTSI